ncbi:MAG: hypothetical protein WA946_01235 [Nitrospirota bacterium]
MKLLRSYRVPFRCMLILIVIALQGCGRADTHPTGVPDGSTITVNPSTITYTSIANFSRDFAVTVKDKTGEPINKAQVQITGAFAEPRNATNTTARYQFYRYTGGENTVGNIPVNSGFTAETDSYGVYNFSVTVYGSLLVSGVTVTNSFTDTIDISSGNAFGSVVLTIN